FLHENLDASPPQMFLNPIFNNTNTIDTAGRAPNVVVRSGTPHDHGATLAYSDDYGRSWLPISLPPLRFTNAQCQPEERRFDLPGDVPITVSADGLALIAATPIAIVSRDGVHWDLAKDLPAGTRPIADRVNGKRFYAIDFSGGALYVSNDAGTSF